MHSASIVVWSTDIEQAHGQAIMTRRIATELLPKFAQTKLCVFPEGLYLWRWLSAIVRLYAFVLCASKPIVYIACSRSRLGFVRDVPALLLALLGVRVVVHVHGADFITMFDDPVIGRLAHFCYRNCEVIMISRHLFGRAATIPFKRLYLCENYAVPPLAMESHTTSPPLHITVLWNSNLMASKGIIEALKAFETVSGNISGVSMHVLGRAIGDEELTAEAVQACVDRYNDVENIEILGPVSPEDSIIALNSADIVILPSRYSAEAQPLAVVQAMILGKSVVLTDTPALKSTAENYPAYFASSAAVPDLAVALERAIVDLRDFGDLTKSKHEKAREIAEQRFSINRFDRELVGILLQD